MPIDREQLQRNLEDLARRLDDVRETIPVPEDTPRRVTQPDRQGRGLCILRQRRASQCPGRDCPCRTSWSPAAVEARERRREERLERQRRILREADRRQRDRHSGAQAVEDFIQYGDFAAEATTISNEFNVYPSTGTTSSSNSSWLTIDDPPVGEETPYIWCPPSSEEREYRVFQRSRVVTSFSRPVVGEPVSTLPWTFTFDFLETTDPESMSDAALEARRAMHMAEVAMSVPPGTPYPAGMVEAVAEEWEDDLPSLVPSYQPTLDWIDSHTISVSRDTSSTPEDSTATPEEDQVDPTQ